MELGITKGDWKALIVETNLVDRCFVQKESIHLCEVFGESTEAKQANAQLIADAGTTANKCGLLPSEILEQLTECQEALKEFIDFPKEDIEYWIEDGRPVTITVRHDTLRKALEALNQ
jgi:hypothetical protein